LCTHPELVLISAAAKFGGRLAGHDASAEKPLVALLRVIRVGIRNGSLSYALLRALSLHARHREAIGNE
jgi:hypothetical protein